MRIVPFKPRHASGFLELNRAWLVSHGLWEDTHAEELREPAETIGGAGGRVYIAERRGEVVGSCAVVPREAGVMELKWLAVDPEWQRLGIGRRLLTRGAGYARRNGAERLVTISSERLSTALRLYRRFGFADLTPPGDAPLLPGSIYMQLDFAPSSTLSGLVSRP